MLIKNLNKNSFLGLITGSCFFGINDKFQKPIVSYQTGLNSIMLIIHRSGRSAGRSAQELALMLVRALAQVLDFHFEFSA